eukprot:735000-Prorocentrum_minimum.AAC.1
MKLHSFTRTCEAKRVYSHDGPIGRRKRGYVLTTDQSDAGHVGIFSRRTDRTVVPHNGALGALSPHPLPGSNAAEGEFSCTEGEFAGTEGESNAAEGEFAGTEARVEREEVGGGE